MKKIIIGEKIEKSYGEGNKWRNVLDGLSVFYQINAEGTTVMLVTHDPKIAAQTERIMFMSDGKIISEIHLSKYSAWNLEDRLKKVTMKMREVGI